MLEHGAPSTTNAEPWGTAQLYLLIQRAALKDEQIHSELEQWCTEQHNQITALTEQRNQLTREKTYLQEQVTIAAQAFSDLCPAARAHYAPLPANIAEDSVEIEAHHLKTVFTDLCRENQELQAALAARPTLLDPQIVH